MIVGQNTINICMSYCTQCMQTCCADFKKFHTSEREILKRAFCTYVRQPLFEYACQVWSAKYRYSINKTESVQRFFTRKLHGISNLAYPDRLHALGLETLEHHRLIHDLIPCYKYLHGLIDTDEIVENLGVFSCHLEPKTMV